jgi:hypothetical protein
LNFPLSIAVTTSILKASLYRTCACCSILLSRPGVNVQPDGTTFSVKRSAFSVSPVLFQRAPLRQRTHRTPTSEPSACTTWRFSKRLECVRHLPSPLQPTAFPTAPLSTPPSAARRTPHPNRRGLAHLPRSDHHMHEPRPLVQGLAQHVDEGTFMIHDRLFTMRNTQTQNG